MYLRGTSLSGHGHTNQYTIDSIVVLAEYSASVCVCVCVCVCVAYFGVMNVKHDFAFHTSLMTPQLGSAALSVHSLHPDNYDNYSLLLLYDVVVRQFITEQWFSISWCFVGHAWYLGVSSQYHVSHCRRRKYCDPVDDIVSLDCSCRRACVPACLGVCGVLGRHNVAVVVAALECLCAWFCMC